MSLTVVVVLLLIGGAIGYRVGIWRAEWGIASHGARRTIKNRAQWRE